MARRLFFVDEVRRGLAHLRGDNAQHLTRVLRVEPGQRYEISDNESRYLAEVESAHKSEVTFRVIEKLDSTGPSSNIVLLAALYKFDRYEWMIEKATELGVSRIVPFEAERTEKGLRMAAIKRVERWRKIALEASQQSRRSRLPVIDPSSFAEALAVENAARFVLDEEPGGRPLVDVPSGPDVALLVGPEGGWTDRERASMASRGWIRATLGSNVLRAETAAIAALAVASAFSERTQIGLDPHKSL
jgi:16S rRNA (uracil1498-N3)-methyltransferase